MKIIGLAGPASVGKTTLAKRLRDEHGYVVRSYATPLKQALVALTGFPISYFTDQELKNATHQLLGGKTPREVMQLFGTEFGRDMICENFWCQLMERRIRSTVDVFGHSGETKIVIDDCRFQDEADLVYSMNGTVIQLHRDSVKRTMSHRSENGIAATLNVVIPEGESLSWDYFKRTLNVSGISI